MGDTEVAIVGAGPYGISLAAHLRSRGVPFRIFGEPMKAWLQMPKGMFLKSLGFATSIDVPEPGFDFPGYLEARDLETFEPVSTRDFAEYGIWVQQRFVPNVEQVLVKNIAKAASGDGFELTLADGTQARAKRVVMAVGLGPMARLPKELAGLPPDLMMHTFGQGDFSAWKGKRVAVIGAGASAIESATLMFEQGVDVRLIMRGKEPVLHTRGAQERPLIDKLKAPLSQMGPSRRSWIIEQLGTNMRHIMKRVPEPRRSNLAQYLGPSGSWWLRDRFLGKVPVLVKTSIKSARDEGGKLVLQLAEEGKGEREETFDHVVCGTGFEHNIDLLPMLDPAIRSSLERVRAANAPQLSGNFESSTRGLYFIGPITAYSFGPFFRFVCGTKLTSTVASRHLAARSGLLAALLRRTVAPARTEAR
jgi:hypothetical protein